MKNNTLKYSVFKYIAVVLLCCCVACFASAQDEVWDSNPFELRYRLNDAQKQALEQKNKNPFQIVPPAASLLKQEEDAQRKEESFLGVLIKKRSTDTPIPKQKWLYLFVPLILLVTVIVSGFRDKISLLWSSFFNSNLQNLAFRESVGRSNIHIFLLDLMSIFSFALFALVYLQEEYLSSENFWQAALVAIVISATFIFLKYSVIRFVKSIFPHKKVLDIYLFSVGQYNHLLGLFLLPLALLFIYAPIYILPIIKYIALFCIATWWLFRIFRWLPAAFKFMSSNILLFFAYLCTIEIAPVFILLTVSQLLLGQ